MDVNKLRRLGFDGEDVLAAAQQAAAALDRAGHGHSAIKRALRAVLGQPRAHLTDPLVGGLAALLSPATTPSDGDESAPAPGRTQRLRDDPVPGRVWGPELIDPAAVAQFERARRLPVAVRAALMPDGHVGYGLPIGGVLACRDAVIPYAVGVDIACRMRLTVCAEPTATLTAHRDRLRGALRRETRFGVGAEFAAGERRRHPVMDDAGWQAIKLLADLKDTAAAQLGTSGSGNHFVEFGELVVADVIPELGLPPGRYLALLSHSGSRGLGARTAEHYTKEAMRVCRLPAEAKHLAWLPLDSAAGQEYWLAMSIAGQYAAANHELIHRQVLAAAGLDARATVENHHNFAWLEEHDGERLVVHRKGATPAGAGVLGVIPGSMGDAGYVVRGRGAGASLNSASHGAGRQMSRAAARKSLTSTQRTRYLAAQGIELIAAGIDESPQAYKPIKTVMDAQRDLVDPVAEFLPRLVLMAAGGPAED